MRARRPLEATLATILPLLWVAFVVFSPSLAHAQFSPANGEVRAGTTVTFTWPAAGGAARYAVQVDFTAGALGVGSPFQATTVGAETTVNVIGLPNDGSELFWRVVPSDSFGDDLPSLATQNFINGSAFTLASPIPYKPADGAVVPIGAINSLGWNFVNRANSYIVQVDTDMGFPSPTETTVFGTYAAGPPASLANAGMQFFWKVRAVYTPPNPMAPVEMSDFSATQTFTIGQPTGPDIDAVPATAHFSVSQASPTGQASVQIISRGDMDLNVTSANRRAGADWITGFSFFAADGTTPVSLPRVLPVNQRIIMRIDVDATALSPGSFEGFIDFASNDPDENPFAVTVRLLLAATPSPATCSPADMPPFGNNDGFISQAEADAYANAFINGEHNDLVGVVEANDLAANGGFCPGAGGGPTCGDIQVLPHFGDICVDTTDLATTPFTFTVNKIPSATGAMARLIKLSGDGKVRVTKMSDMTEVLGPDDTEGMDVVADLAAAAVIFVVEGVEPGEVVLQMELVTMSGSDTVNCPPRSANKITLTVFAVDADVDSDNSNSTPDFAPDRDDTEEMLENDGGSTGRVIALNDDDDDGDLIVDLGDAFNLDCSDGTCVLASTTYNISGVLAGDLTEISLAGRGFTDFFSVAPINTIDTVIVAVRDFQTRLRDEGTFYFLPRQGLGSYQITSLRALCGTKQVALTINISVGNGYSAFSFDPGANTIPVNGLNLVPNVYRLEHRLDFFGFPRNQGTVQQPILQGGAWTTIDSTSFKLFSAVTSFRQFPPVGYQGDVIKDTIFADWLSATNAPRWKTVPLNTPPGLRNPAFASQLDQLTSWALDLINKALELRPALIRNSAGALIGKVAMFRGSGKFTSLNIQDCGMTFAWTWDPQSLQPSGGDDGSFPTTGQQALIDDILAFRDAKTALGDQVGAFFAIKLQGPSSPAAFITRRDQVVSHLQGLGLPVTPAIGAPFLIDFTLAAPPKGPSAPPQAPPIN